MSGAANLPLILSAAFLATASPGPATIAIADMSLRAGRKAGLMLAAGVTTGSLIWSISAALGLAAAMASSACALHLLKYAGAAYLLFLACKSARSAFRPAQVPAKIGEASARRRSYLRGVLLHLTNPKPIIFFGSLYTLGVSPHASSGELMVVVLAVGAQSAAVFGAYALLFSNPGIAASYSRLRRWFEGAFALLFATAGLKLLTTRFAN